jgi:repressor LexA
MKSTQEKILNYIKSEIRSKGYPPTVREIGEAVGLASSSTVHGHLDRLEKKGFIRRDPAKPRAIDVLDTQVSKHSFEEELVRIPIVGKVTAGQPITAVENIEEYFPFKKGRVDKNSFMLEVRGNSMILAGIHNGDYVIVRQQPDAENGEIVVALTEQDEATVKTLYKEKDHVRLQPENPDMEPLIFKHVKILGKVIGVLRRFN